jgi:hypothetical protein
MITLRRRKFLCFDGAKRRFVFYFAQRRCEKLKVYSQTDIYIRRVLREFKKSYDDAYIEAIIRKDVLKKIDELSGGDSSDKSVALALQKLGPASELGKAYKKQYAETAQRISAFLMFNRFFVNLSAAALILVAAFVVFRVSPQTEYVAYSVCAVSGAAAAVISYINFYKRSYMVITMALPAYLLLYYPIKDALRAYRRYGEPFFKNLFSYDNHALYLIIFSYLAAFILTVSWLHTMYIFKKRSRVCFRVLTVLLAAAAFLGFAAYAVTLKQGYDEEAALLLGKIENLYRGYLETGKLPDELVGLAHDVHVLAKRYGTIYIPSDKLVTDSFSELVHIFRLYDSGYENLVLHYHPVFNIEKGAFFDTETLGAIIKAAKERASVSLLGEARDFKGLLNILSRCETLRLEIISAVDVCFEEWAYSDIPR